MGFFRRLTDTRVAEIEHAARQGFERVRQDTNNLYAWIEYFNRRNSELQEQNKELIGDVSELTDINKSLHREVRGLKDTVDNVRKRLVTLPSQLTREDVRRIVDSHYSLDPLIARLRVIEHRISALENRRERVVVREIQPVKKQVSQLREKIIRRVAARSKEYLKGVINNIIQKYGRISAVQIREMVVDEQGLCSRSSFYRVLEELEHESGISVIIGKKEKVYMAKAKKASRT